VKSSRVTCSEVEGEVLKERRGNEGGVSMEIELEPRRRLIT
jgi:hypothetical protein